MDAGKLHFNFAKIQRKVLILLLFTLASHVSSAQGTLSMNYKFKILDKNGKKYGLTEWLENGVPVPNEKECRPTWDVFYFRVNALGKVDTVSHGGNLRKKVVDKILDNIYTTQGHWIIPNGAKPNDFCWYVFAYFDFGGTFSGTSNCSEADKLLQETVISLSEMLGKVGIYMGENKASLIGPSKNGGGYLKL
jgi:hypothetical protein